MDFARKKNWGVEKPLPVELDWCAIEVWQLGFAPLAAMRNSSAAIACSFAQCLQPASLLPNELILLYEMY